MANKKITELSANTSPSFSDVLPIVNSGTTKKLSLSGLTDFLSTTELKFPDAPIDGNQYARENGDWAIIQSQLNEITYSAGFTIDTNQVTMLSGWTWTINGIGYTNLVDVIINIPAASDGFRRIDLIVADVLDTFYLVQGIESNDIPVAPNLPVDTLQATFITVNGSTVDVTPVDGNFVTIDTTQTIIGAKLFTQDIFINNMRVGMGMGNLDTNVVFGANAFSANTSGTFNVGVGQNSLQKNITGNNNTAIGAFTLANPTASSFNVAIGTAALQHTTTGDQNIGIGASSLRNTTSGLRNIGIGASSLLNNIIGINNTGIGNQALLRSTGDYNVAIGKNAGAGIVSGNKNIIITNDTTLTTLGLTNGSNNIFLGSAVTGILTGSSNVIIGTVTGLSSTLSNNIIFGDGSGNQRLKINENGIINIPTTPSINLSGTSLLTRNSSTGNLEIVPVSAITSGITVPSLQEVTTVNHSTTKGIFVDNPYGQYFLGTEFMGGTPRFLVTSNGDDTIFPGQNSVLIQADLNEWINISSTDGTSSTNISNTPLQARISKNIGSTAYTLNIDEFGIGIETNGNYGYLKTDNLTSYRTHQLPDVDGTILTTAGTVIGYPITGSFEVTGSNKIYADDGVSTSSIIYSESAINIESYMNDDSTYASLSVNNNGSIVVNTTISGSPSNGLTGQYDYSNNINDLDYTQKKYVKDNFISISGTQSGSPVTGPIQVTPYGAVANIYTTDGTDSGGLYIDTTEVSIGLENPTSGYNSFMGVFNDSGYISIQDPASRGLTSDVDYTANITDLDFTQKKYVDAQRPYKIYTALLSQTGTSAPTAIVLENTLGGEIVWSYFNTGDYIGTLNNTFIENKTSFIPPVSSINDCIGGMERLDVDSIRLNTKSFTLNTASNDVLYNDTIEIRIYN